MKTGFHQVPVLELSIVDQDVPRLREFCLSLLPECLDQKGGLPIVIFIKYQSSVQYSPQSLPTSSVPPVISVLSSLGRRMSLSFRPMWPAQYV